MEVASKQRSLDYRFTLLAIITMLSPVIYQLTEIAAIKIADDIVFILLVIDSIVAIYKKKIETKFDHTSLLVIIIFAIYLLGEAIYALINQNSLLVVILRLRQYKYIFMFIIIMCYNSEQLFDSLYKIQTVIAYLSIPVSIIQRYLSSDIGGDYVTGLYGIGASGTMTLFLLILFFIEYTIRLTSKRNIIGWYFLYFIPIAINETKIAFFLIPILFIVSLILTKRLNLKNIIITIVMISILGYAANFAYKTLYKRDVTDIFSTKFLTSYLTEQNDYDLGRAYKLQIAYNIISRTKLNTLLGYGLGSVYTGQDKLGMTARDNYEANVFRGTRPLLFDLIIDLGIVGVGLLFFLIIVLFFRIIKMEKRPLQYAAVFSLVIWSVGMGYQDIFMVNGLAMFMFSSIYLACITKENEIVKYGEVGNGV